MNTKYIWVVFRCQGSSTIELSDKLREANVRGYVPRYITKIRLPRKKGYKWVYRPMLPSFIFVISDDIALAESVIGRHASLMKYQGNGFFISHTEIMAMAEQIDSQYPQRHPIAQREAQEVASMPQWQPPAIDEFLPGDKVRIKSGPLSGFPATVIKAKHEEVKIDLPSGAFSGVVTVHISLLEKV